MLKVPTKQDKTWVYGTPDGNGNAVAQNIIQKFLIFVAILAIPVMLLAKPYIKYKAHKGRFPRTYGNLCSLVLEKLPQNRTNVFWTSFGH